MAAVAGAGGGDQMRRQRLPLADLTNFSSATSVITRSKPKRTSPGSSIGSSTVLRIPTPPPPPPATLSVSVSVSGSFKVPLRTHLNKIQKISKPKVKTRGVLPGPSSPPSKNTRKMTRKEHPHTETEPLISLLHASSKTKAKTGGDVLTGISSPPPNKKTRKVTSREEQPRTVPLIAPFYASSKTRLKTGDRLPGASSSPSSKKTRKVTSSSMEEQLQMEAMSSSWSGGPTLRRSTRLSWWRSLFLHQEAMQIRRSGPLFFFFLLLCSI